MTLTDVGAAAGSLVAIGALLTMLWRGGRHVFVSLVDQLDERVQSHTVPINHRVAAIEVQLAPNGGESLRDAVDRIEAQVSGFDEVAAQARDALRDAVDRIESRVDTIEASTTAIQTTVEAVENGGT